MQVQIPKKLYHIWIGPRPAPEHWMQTWVHFHPSWDYLRLDNNYIQGRRFKNQKLIDDYMKRFEFAGAADLIRYEILDELGGFIPEADSICLQATDELWKDQTAYTVYENEMVRGKLVSPILASVPSQRFVANIVSDLNKKTVFELDAPWKTTGNLYMARKIEEESPSITIFPSYYFIPDHYTGVSYTGSGKVYAKQFFAETSKIYKKANIFYEFKKIRAKRYSKKMRRFLINQSQNQNLIEELGPPTL